MAGLATSFGSGAMSNSMDDVAAQAKSFFVIGSNTTEQHPVFGTMLRRAAKFRGAKIVVADPRKIDLTEFAALHIRQRPGTDIALVNGLMHIILEKGWEDKTFVAERTENFDEFKATVYHEPFAGGAALSFALIAVGTYLLLRHGQRLVAAMIPMGRVGGEGGHIGPPTFWKASGRSNHVPYGHGGQVSLPRYFKHSPGSSGRKMLARIRSTSSSTGRT